MFAVLATLVRRYLPVHLAFSCCAVQYFTGRPKEDFVMIQRVVFGTFVGFVLVVAFVQGSLAQRFEFDAASIKPNIAGDHRSRIQMMPGGRLNVTAATLKDLLRTAYQVDNFQIIGGPAWMSSDRWDIQATAYEDVSQKRMGEMLQNLIVDRFQLKS